MKVYLATAGVYSDYRVCHVFRNREDAEAYEGADDLEEYELREGPVERRTRYRFWWYPEQAENDRNPWMYSESCDYDGGKSHVEHEWKEQHVGGPCLRVEGWDREGVLKVYSEQRAQYLAAQQGVS